MHLSSEYLQEHPIFTQLKVWVIVFIISDFFFLLFVTSFYLLFHSYLYKFAYFKSIICTCLLAFNFLFLGYGAYIIASMPNDYSDTPSGQ
jgi:hypothetical protein